MRCPRFADTVLPFSFDSASFGLALGDDESVDGKLSRLLMDGEFEAVGEERLQHLLLLQPALVGGEVLHPVTDGGIGLRLDVELVRINPG